MCLTNVDRKKFRKLIVKIVSFMIIFIKFSIFFGFLMYKLILLLIEIYYGFLRSKFLRNAFIFLLIKKKKRIHITYMHFK